MLNLAIALGLAAFLGFAAQRASVCTVRAVAEVLSSGSASFLISFAKTAIWALPISVVVLWSGMQYAPLAATYPLSWTALLGGTLFGLGAAANGACAFSTLAYFAEGQMPMLASFAGYIVGVRVWDHFHALPILHLPEAMPSLLAVPATASITIVLVACLWVLWESWRLWRTGDRTRSGLQRLLADRYRLSTAAMIIGICAGLLYAMSGAWTYTSVLRKLALRNFEGTHASSGNALALLLAVLCGMWLSAWQRGKLHLNLGGAGDWLRRLLGGVLMGFGASLVPGGNDEIVLRAFPLLSPHAIPAYCGVLAGIAAGLLILKVTARRTLHVSCVGDTFKESWISSSSSSP